MSLREDVMRWWCLVVVRVVVDVVDIVVVGVAIR